MRVRLGIVILLLWPFREAGLAQPCNPVVDGTYCASLPSPPAATSNTKSQRFESLGSSLSGLPYDQPATLGTMTFRGDGSQCIGLLRRGVCK
jgi:hypothetical protein